MSYLTARPSQDADQRMTYDPSVYRSKVIGAAADAIHARSDANAVNALIAAPVSPSLTTICQRGRPCARRHKFVSFVCSSYVLRQLAALSFMRVELSNSAQPKPAAISGTKGICCHSLIAVVTLEDLKLPSPGLVLKATSSYKARSTASRHERDSGSS